MKQAKQQQRKNHTHTKRLATLAKQLIWFVLFNMENNIDVDVEIYLNPIVSNVFPCESGGKWFHIDCVKTFIFQLNFLCRRLFFISLPQMRVDSFACRFVCLPIDKCYTSQWRMNKNGAINLAFVLYHDDDDGVIEMF